MYENEKRVVSACMRVCLSVRMMEGKGGGGGDIRRKKC